MSVLLAKIFPSLASVSSDTQHAQNTTNNTKTVELQCIVDFVFFIFTLPTKNAFLSKGYRPEEWGYVNFSTACQK